MKAKRLTAFMCAAALAGMTAYAAPVGNGDVSLVSAAGDILEVSGTAPENSIDTSTHYYDNQDKTVKGYLYQSGEDTITRVEYVASLKKIVVETYDMASGELKKSKQIDMKLSVFGGFFAGEKYNYIVEGENNADEDPNKEVFTVIRYTKDWSSWKSKSLVGINTQYPFDAGSCDMTEYGGKLYIHTCHQMFKSEDGRNHQANMSFILDEETMEFENKNYEVTWHYDSNPFPYSSHSFDQRIINDGKALYTYDHGDAYPRSMYLCKYDFSTKTRSESEIVSIPGSTGANYTSITTGDMTYSADNIIIGAKMADLSGGSLDTYTDLKDIWLLVTPKSSIGEDGNAKRINLTNYSSSQAKCKYNSAPHIAKVNDNKFIVMWKELENISDTYDWDTKTWKTVESGATFKIAVVDGNGRLQGSIMENTDIELSDCEPILCSDGNVRWYANSDGKAKIYVLDPDDPNNFSDGEYEPVSGDLNRDGYKNINDVLLIQQSIAGWGVDIDKDAADVNGDGTININDVLLLQQFLAGWKVKIK